ncbi:MAG: L-threonylcarbamoyladenylate synthase [Acidimicrobiia bacterium]|nr:L-threonylcarbamoyladenylate synthase [Acidimicrobiia bacterium]
MYGLGADAANASALRRLYEVKRRPADHPVIVHVGTVEELDDWGHNVSADARRLVEACWPGPLTVVVDRTPDVLDEVTGGQATVAVRMPDHPIALALLRAFGRGVAAPSANRFGSVSPTTADHVIADLGDDVDVVLDGGPCRVGVESTIVDCTHELPTVLRPGAISTQRIASLTGSESTAVSARRTIVRVPGSLQSHYAPRARVVMTDREDLVTTLDAIVAPGTRVGVLGSGDLAIAHDPAHDDVVRLEVPADPDGYAAALYRELRSADEQELDVVVAVLPAPDGIGAAVIDRLERAAGASEQQA